MKQVSKEVFCSIFDAKLDVHPKIVTDWPYTELWTFHRKIGEPVYGKTVLRVEGGRLETDYYVQDP